MYYFARIFRKKAPLSGVFFALIFVAQSVSAALSTNNKSMYIVSTDESLQDNTVYFNSSSIYTGYDKSVVSRLNSQIGTRLINARSFYNGYLRAGDLVSGGIFLNKGSFVNGQNSGSIGSLNNSFKAIVNNSGTFFNAGHGVGLINNSGTFNNTGSLYNAEYEDGNATLTNKSTGLFNNTGLLFNGYRGSASLENMGAFTNSGTVYNGFEGLGSAVNNGLFTNKGAVYNAFKSSASFVNNSTFNNSGTLYNAYSAAGSYTNSGLLNNVGSIYNGYLAHGTMSNNGSLINYGTLYNGYLSDAKFTNNGVFSNYKTINNKGSFVNAVGGLFNSYKGSVYGGTIENEGTLNLYLGSSFGSIANKVAVFDQNSGDFNVSNAKNNYIGFLNIKSGKINLKTVNDKIIVIDDYNNAGFGVGNSFNFKANISGSGSIIPFGNARQGVAINDGEVTTGSSSINFGNVHVGSSQLQHYSIFNTGTSGPAIRGAVQTGGNTGAVITDNRLTGSGVTESNYDSLPVDVNSVKNSSHPYAVNFDATSSGALVNQKIKIVDNFGDAQIVQIKGAAYNLAEAKFGQANINFPNQRIGGNLSKNIVVSNSAPTGLYSEKLDATISSVSSGLLANGSFTKLAAGTTDRTHLSVALDTQQAGHITGHVNVNLVSNGLGTSGLGTTMLSSQSVNASGNVYRLATPDVIPDVSIPVLHVGEVFNHALTITNTAVNDGYSEKLNARFGQSVGAISTNNGSVDLLTASSSNDTAMSVSVDTSSAGAKSGSVVVNYQSDGSGTSGFGAIDIASQAVNVNAKVYNYAQAGLTLSSGGGVLTGSGLDWVLNLGNIQQNSGIVTSTLTLENIGPNSIWTDLLSGNFSDIGLSPAIVNTASNFSNLAGGRSTQFQIAVNTAHIGVFTDLLFFTLISSNDSGYSGDLGLIRIALSGDVLDLLNNNVSAVPEPEQWLMFSLGLLIVLNKHRKQNKLFGIKFLVGCKA